MMKVKFRKRNVYDMWWLEGVETVICYWEHLFPDSYPKHFEVKIRNAETGHLESVAFCDTMKRAKEVATIAENEAALRRQQQKNFLKNK